MIELTINTTVQASATNTLFFVIGSRHPLTSSLSKCNSRFGRGRNNSSNINFISFSSRVDANVVTYDADVYHVDIEGKNTFNYSDSTLLMQMTKKMLVFSSANNYANDDDETIAEKRKNFKRCVRSAMNDTTARQQRTFD